MIVDDLDVVGVAVDPAEADAPLVVDADAVLAGPVAAELLEAIARRDAQVLEVHGTVDQAELPEHDAAEVGRESADGFARPETLGVAVSEAPNHPR